MKRLHALLAAAALGLAACDGTDESGVPTEMQPVGSAVQEVPTNGRAEPLRVRLRTIVGDPTPGIRVQWTLLSGTASIDSSRSLTNEDGIAETGVTVGSAVGEVRIRASVPGVAVDPKDFTLNVVHPGGGGGGGGGGQQSVGAAPEPIR